MNIERPPACPKPGVIEAFDAGWNAHEIGMSRSTVETLAGSPGWALLGYDFREHVENSIGSDAADVELGDE